jgi:hypothetical protein
VAFTKRCKPNLEQTEYCSAFVPPKVIKVVSSKEPQNRLAIYRHGALLPEAWCESSTLQSTYSVRSSSQKDGNSRRPPENLPQQILAQTFQSAKMSCNSEWAWQGESRFTYQPRPIRIGRIVFPETTGDCKVAQRHTNQQYHKSDGNAPPMRPPYR